MIASNLSGIWLRDIGTDYYTRIFNNSIPDQTGDLAIRLMARDSNRTLILSTGVVDLNQNLATSSNVKFNNITGEGSVASDGSYIISWAEDSTNQYIGFIRGGSYGEIKSDSNILFSANLFYGGDSSILVDSTIKPLSANTTDIGTPIENFKSIYANHFKSFRADSPFGWLRFSVYDPDVNQYVEKLRIDGNKINVLDDISLSTLNNCNLKTVNGLIVCGVDYNSADINKTDLNLNKVWAKDANISGRTDVNLLKFTKAFGCSTDVSGDYVLDISGADCTTNNGAGLRVLHDATGISGFAVGAGNSDGDVFGLNYFGGSVNATNLYGAKIESVNYVGSPTDSYGVWISQSYNPLVNFGLYVSQGKTVLHGDTTVLDSNLSVSRYINVGTNRANNLSLGDINASTIYYNSLVPKSPVFFESSDGNYTIFCYLAKSGTGAVIIGSYDEVNTETLEITTKKVIAHPACMKKQQELIRDRTDFAEYDLLKSNCTDSNHSLNKSYDAWLSTGKRATCVLDCARAGLVEVNGKCRLSDEIKAILIKQGIDLNAVVGGR